MKAKDQQRLRRLTKITNAAFQAAQARLQEKSQAEANCQAALDQLEQDRAKVLTSLQISENVSPAQIVVDAQWLRWAENRRGQLNMSLARAKAAAVRERATAQRAFGRHQVATNITKKR